MEGLEELGVDCPHCNQTIHLDIEPDATGHFVEDCHVCCRPLLIRVHREDGGWRVEARPENG